MFLLIELLLYGKVRGCEYVVWDYLSSYLLPVFVGGGFAEGCKAGSE
jgi:hypothetical protein